MVEREHCLLYGTDLVCAICEAPHGDEHDESCPRHYPAITREGMVALGIPFQRYCHDCARPFEAPVPTARYCPECASRTETPAGAGAAGEGAAE